MNLKSAGRGTDWATENLYLKTTPISVSQLLPGDALLRSVADPSEDHVALFVRWSDSAYTEPVMLEESGGAGRAVERTWTWGFSGYTPGSRQRHLGTGAKRQRNLGRQRHPHRHQRLRDRHRVGRTAGRHVALPGPGTRIGDLGQDPQHQRNVVQRHPHRHQRLDQFR